MIALIIMEFSSEEDSLISMQTLNDMLMCCLAVLAFSGLILLSIYAFTPEKRKE